MCLTSATSTESKLRTRMNGVRVLALIVTNGEEGRMEDLRMIMPVNVQLASTSTNITSTSSLNSRADITTNPSIHSSEEVILNKAINSHINNHNSKADITTNRSIHSSEEVILSKAIISNNHNSNNNITLPDPTNSNSNSNSMDIEIPQHNLLVVIMAIVSNPIIHSRLHSGTCLTEQGQRFDQILD